MRPLLAALLLITLPAAASAAGDGAACPRPYLAPVTVNGVTVTVFTDACGNRYEVGYRLDGTTLHFPQGGSHTITDADAETAERLLREAYGLTGPRDALIRTRWTG